MSDHQTPESADSLQDWHKNLDNALDELELQSVEWDKECEADIKEAGYPLGDGKEKRRARKWVMNCIDELIAAALQSERQRIADSLPEKKTMDAAKSSGSDAGWGCTYGFNEALAAVRAVLIPPTGKLGGLATPSEPAEPKDTKSITEASASEEEQE